MTLPQLQQEAREKFEKETGFHMESQLGIVSDTLIASAYQAGKDAAVEYIKEHCEEVGPPENPMYSMYYIAVSSLRAARNSP